MRGNETPGRIMTNFCTGVGVHDVITCADLYYDRLRGLGVAGVKFWLSPLTCFVALTTLSFIFIHQSCGIEDTNTASAVFVSVIDLLAGVISLVVWCSLSEREATQSHYVSRSTLYRKSDCGVLQRLTDCACAVPQRLIRATGDRTRTQIAGTSRLEYAQFPLWSNTYPLQKWQ